MLMLIAQAPGSGYWLPNLINTPSLIRSLVVFMNWLIFVRTIAGLKIQSAIKTHSNVSGDLLLLVSVHRGLQLEGCEQKHPV